MKRIVDLDKFGDWSLSEQVFGWILANIPIGSTIFELGFGIATGELVRAGYIVYSVEHCGVWADKRHEIIGNDDRHVLIQVPIKNGWYDVDVLKPKIPEHYDLLIIDGPDTVERHHTLDNKNLFNDYSAVVIDDYCELYDTSKVGAYFSWKNGGAVDVIANNNKSAMCIKGRGRGH